MLSCYICHANHAPQTDIGRVAPTTCRDFSLCEYRLTHCNACDAIRLEPRPPRHDLELLYLTGDQFSCDIYTSEERVKLVLEYLHSRLSHSHLLPASGEAVLEVGAGLAWMARACKERNPAIRTCAFDITSECIGTTPWVDRYIVGSWEEIPSEERFRLISLTHVIEHLPDPAETLRDLAGRLAPGGRLFVTGPFRPIGWRTGDGLDPWLGYSYLHVPGHISYLSETWFRQQSNLQLTSWDQSPEDGQAFEAILAARA